MELWEILSSNDAAFLIVDGIFAFVLIVFGLFSLAVIPRKPNWIMGYRTPMACKNQDTWVFAHKHFGKQMIIFGFVYVILLIIRVLLVENEASSLVLGGIIAAQVIAVLLALIPTEIALRKEFDKDGIRKR
ncbi:MAG: SdpI family protein [Defluviitaleaceae bacterium]|nr:SdpI family protein [Defluviitaleaceae bacterium]